jgi:hypothetical protein
VVKGSVLQHHDHKRSTFSRFAAPAGSPSLISTAASVAGQAVN